MVIMMQVHVLHAHITHMPDIRIEYCVYIFDSESLVSFCKRASASKVIAVDTEFMREKTYYPQLCLIQVATHDEAAAIDPLLIDDLSSLEELLFNHETVKVFHSCAQDLEVIYHVFGAVPAPVFDTQVAAAFLGLRLRDELGGLGLLAREACGDVVQNGDVLDVQGKDVIAGSAVESSGEDLLGDDGWMLDDLPMAGGFSDGGDDALSDSSDDGFPPGHSD